MKVNLVSQAHSLAFMAMSLSASDQRESVQEYLDDFGHICSLLESRVYGQGPVEKARSIFDWLWEVRPDRYQSGGNFRFTEVVGAQLSKRGRVGNCLGLTLLYNSLCRHFGVYMKAVHLPEAFGRGPHVFSLLRMGSKTVDIENIFTDGFDYQGHTDSPGRQEWGDKELLADLLMSEGNALFERGEFRGAAGYYDMALVYNPDYASARCNKGLALVQMGRMEEAAGYLAK